LSFSPQEEARREVQRLVQAGVESIAGCFLHAYANPQPEQMVGGILARKAPGVCVSLSSQVLLEMKEYERTSRLVPLMVSMLVFGLLAYNRETLRESDTTTERQKERVTADDTICIGTVGQGRWQSPNGRG
jgi:hypothetical protein